VNENSIKKQNKIRLALKLYPFYEAASGDMLFFSIIETLFLMQVKGFSAADIALILFITHFADLILEYPSYIIIRRFGNGASGIIGGIMPLIGILFITLAQSQMAVIIGNIFCVSAVNFQSAAGAGARNNLAALGEKDKYAELFSKSNVIYTAVSMAAAVFIPFLYSLNKYIPSILCIITFFGIAVISFFLKDFTEKEHSNLPLHLTKNNYSLGKIGRKFILLIIVFCLFFCAGGVFTKNTEVFLGKYLGELFNGQQTIFIFGAVIWASRFIRLIVNILLPKILNLLKENIVTLSAYSIAAAFLIIGAGGLFFSKTILPVIAAGTAYIIIRGVIWDIMRTYLRMSAIDINNKQRQQTMIVLLNAGQSIVCVIMDLTAVSILKLFPLEYVFFAFALISIVIVIYSIMLKRELKKHRII